MDNKEKRTLLRDQLVRFTIDKENSYSLGIVLSVFSINWVAMPEGTDSILMLQNKSNSISLTDFAGAREDHINEYSILINNLRTNLTLGNFMEVFNNIQTSSLIEFVDKDSAKLIGKEFRTEVAT